MNILLLILIAPILSQSEKQARYSLKSNFPIYEEDDFVLTLHAENTKLPVYTIVVLRCSKRLEIIEEHVLNPGFLRALPSRFNGDCFQVNSYLVKPFAIEIVLRFKRLGDGGQFHVFFLETASQSERQRVSDHPDRPGGPPALVVLDIALLLHWRLELVQRTPDHREGALLPGAAGLLVCRAAGGAPFSQVRFVDVGGGLAGLQNAVELATPPSSSMAPVNEAHLSFSVRIEDHSRLIGCEAGNDRIERPIRVFHHPSRLVFSPGHGVLGGFVKNGSRISCAAKDGYPPAQARWTWISGPANAPLYFSIESDSPGNGLDTGTGAVLTMAGSAPLDSQWTFQCSASNTIANSLDKGVMEIVSFRIGDRPVPYIFISCVVVGSVIVVLLLLALLCYCVCVRKTRTRHSSLTKATLLHQSSAAMISDEDGAAPDKSEMMTHVNGSIPKLEMSRSRDRVDEV